MTVIRATESARSSRMSTRPPIVVNLIALVRRFQTTCCRRLGSAEMGPRAPSRLASSLMLRASAAVCTASTADTMTETRSTDRTSRRSLPVMMRETSRRSSISWASTRVLRSMTSGPRRAPTASSVPDRSRRTQPRIAFSGVRSSWESVARNSSFARFASSSLRRDSSRSRTTIS